MRSWSRDSPGRSALGAAGGAPTGVPRRAPPGRTACDCAQRISVSRSWSSSVRRAWPTYRGDRADGGHGGMRRSWSAATISGARLERSRSVRKANGAIPPSRWQPRHVSRTIGATSRAKSGAALPDPSAGSATAAPSVAAANPTQSGTLRAITRIVGGSLLGLAPSRTKAVVGAPELSERAAQLADRRPHRERGA